MFMKRQFADRDAGKASAVIPILQAQIRVALSQLVDEISRNFSIQDINRILDQLIARSRGRLEQYREDMTLMTQECTAIVRELDIHMLPEMQVVEDYKAHQRLTLMNAVGCCLAQWEACLLY